MSQIAEREIYSRLVSYLRNIRRDDRLGEESREIAHREEKIYMGRLDLMDQDAGLMDLAAAPTIADTHNPRAADGK